MNEKNVLVTGGAGFVGRHFVKWLVDREYKVMVVDDLSTGLAPEYWPSHLKIKKSQEKLFSFYKMDFRDFVKAHHADFGLIIHLAAVVGGRMTIEGDPLKVATDLAIDATFFNWVVKEKPLPRKVLYFSSSAVYPISEQTPENHHPLSEDMVNFNDSTLGIPDMTYGWSKLSGEFLAQVAAKMYGLDVVIYRPFSGYGEDQDFTYPFPSIIRRVGRKENPIVIWGSGNQLRDFIYIDDCVEAVFASANKMKPGEAMNLGSGVGTSFQELARISCRVIGHKADIVNDATKPEGVFGRVANCQLMHKYYHPKVSLEAGIRIVHEYLANQRLLN